MITETKLTHRDTEETLYEDKDCEDWKTLVSVAMKKGINPVLATYDSGQHRDIELLRQLFVDRRK